MDLAARWEALVRAAGLPPDRAAGEDLLRRWSEPARRYHTLDHLRHCLEELDDVRALLEDPAAAELALWFHDAVYDPRGADNEERSALLFREWAARAGLERARAARIEEWILLTRHGAGEAAGDAAFVLDADLAVLSLDPAAYAGYERRVREEYAWVEEAVFRRERARILRGFLGRPSIYRTERFRGRCEELARRNLADAVAVLEASPPCPRCGRPADPGSKHLPFCSDRCRLLDLGKWMREDYVVGRPLRPGDVPAEEE